MSRGSKALAGATAIAAGPSGLRRLAGGCLVVILLGGLALAGLLAFAAWSARQSGGETSALPCPPESVAVVFTPRDTPAEVRERVETALRSAGRKPVRGGWSEGQTRDLVVAWTPGTESRLSGGTGPSTLRLGEVPSVTSVTALLGDRLAACETASPPPSPAQDKQPTGGAQEPAEGSTGFAWPWAGGWSPATWVGLAAGLWWVAGPNLVRAAGRGLWPLRLGWRRMQRAAYRRRLRRGQWPAEWPEPLMPGQRWHESAAAMHDRQGFRAQIAEGEPERKASLRDEIRASLTGQRGSWASVMRLAYRVPAHKGASEREGVSQ